MLYALLIYGREAEWDAMDRAQRHRQMDSHIKAAQITHADGVLLAGVRLRPTSFASTVRSTANGITVTDGPFAETKEQFGGFQLLDCPTFDDAVRYAKQLVECSGTVEIRPVHPLSASID
jgi:hypothetical protein